MAGDTPNVTTIELAAELTAAWLSNPNTRAGADDVLAFFNTIHVKVSAMANPARPIEAATLEAAEPVQRAVTVRKSLASPEVILSMIDGKPYRSLTRHLSSNGMTPDEYRTRFGLRPDYPMTAPAYSEMRRAMAKKIGLGRKAGETVGKKAERTSTTQGKPAAARAPRNGIGAAKDAAKAHLGMSDH